MKKVIVSSSGGKDSILALYKAVSAGYSVEYIANTISHDYRRVRFHGVQAEIIQKQADALSIRLLQKETTAQEYEKEYKDNLRDVIRKEKIDGLVFGDIHLEGCFNWAKKVCLDLGVELIEPLWKMSAEDVLAEFINSGFGAKVVSTQADILDKSWVGREINNDFLNDLTRLGGVDLCGENGEYHTLVLDGPIFKRRLAIESENVLINGYWFLDIKKVVLA